MQKNAQVSAVTRELFADYLSLCEEYGAARPSVKEYVLLRQQALRETGDNRLETGHSPYRCGEAPAFIHSRDAPPANSSPKQAIQETNNSTPITTTAEPEAEKTPMTDYDILRNLPDPWN